jgi:hypothetical protein
MTRRLRAYSITSSARASSVSGTSRPSALAVLRLITRGNTADKNFRTAEAVLEERVSRVIGAMHFAWLAIDDDPGPTSMRGYIERNAIALLSNYGKTAIDPPSLGWLGHNERETGLLST